MRFDLPRLASRWWPQLSRRRRASPWTVAELTPQRLSAVTVAPARNGQRPAVLAAASVEIDPSAPQAAALAEFAAPFQSRCRRWALLLPRDDYRLSVMPEPAVPADELGNSLRWQLAATLDFPVEDAAIDWMNIPTLAWQPERAAELYAVAARGETVQAKTALFRAAHLNLQVIDIRETAQRNIAALLEHQSELLVLVAFCADEVRISFNWHGELYMDRLIAEPSFREESAERRGAAAERVQLQIQRSLDAVRENYPFMQTARIVLAGAPESFHDRLAASLPDPVEVLAPDALFDLSQVPSLNEPAVFMDHFHALGVALRDQESLA